MELNVSQLTTINQARVRAGLQDLALSEANDQVKHLPPNTDPWFLMGWEKGEPPPETVEEAAFRYERYRHALARQNAEAAAKKADEAKDNAEKKEQEAVLAVAAADKAKEEASAIEAAADEAASLAEEAAPPLPEPIEEEPKPKRKKK